MFQKLFGILLVATACSGLIVACGETAANDCLTSEDCAPDERCNLVSGECAFACDSDDECELDGEICDTDAGDGGGVCVLEEEPDNNNNEPECTSDADCDEAAGETCDTDTGMCVGGDTPECADDTECGASEFCTEDGTCERLFGYARITDVSDTSDDSLCGDDLDDPGSDIFGVELRGADGESSFWADNVYDFDITHTGTLADAESVLTGDAPGIDADNCPEAGFSDSVVALGCGGSVIVEFLDDSDQAVDILPGDDIVVYEYGSQCNNNDVQDEWTIEVCELTSDAATGSCDNPVELGSGEGFATVGVDAALWSE